jgi:hypothetical protein
LADTVLKVKPDISAPSLAAAVNLGFQAQLAVAENSRFELESLINAAMNKLRGSVFVSWSSGIKKIFLIHTRSVFQSLQLSRLALTHFRSDGRGPDSLCDISEDSHQLPISFLTDG